MSKQKVIYVSMPISGYDLQERVAKAEKHRNYLNKLYTNAKIVTPFDEELGGLVPDKSYGWYMGNDVQYIIDNVDVIYFDEDYKQSKGALVEHYIGEVYKKELAYAADQLTVEYIASITDKHTHIEGSDGYDDFDIYTIKDYKIEFRHNLSNTPGREWSIHVDNEYCETIAYIDVQTKSQVNKLFEILEINYHI